jgi:hypothetical protein
MEQKIVLNFRFPTEHPRYNELATIISQAIDQLPNDVKEFILTKNKIILSTECDSFRANAFCISKKDFLGAKYLIHFHYHIWDLDKKEVTRIIQHEIAHVYLGHYSTESHGQQEKMEEEAGRLTKEWGKGVK